MWTWLIGKATGMVVGSFSKIALYGGLIVTGLVALSSVVFMIRKGGSDAVRVKQQKARLDSIARKRKIDDEIDTLDTIRLRERAARWQN